MKLISWNVNYRNKNLKHLVEYVTTLNPDVICFQEFPESKLDFLKAKNQYILFYKADATTNTQGTNMLTLTAIRNTLNPLTSFSYNYFKKPYKSFLRNYFYRVYGNLTEKNWALIVDLEETRIINTRLSTATGPNNRVEMLTNIMQLLKEKPENIICGDLNTCGSILFNLCTGAFRGYKGKEFLLDEKGLIEKLLFEHNMQNPFKGEKTTAVGYLPHMQFDYVLLDKQTKVDKKNLGSNAYESDHHMLCIEIKKRLHNPQE